MPGFKGRVGLVDYSNPKAVEVQAGYLRKLFSKGIKLVQTDFGEAAQSGRHLRQRPAGQAES